MKISSLITSWSSVIHYFYEVGNVYNNTCFMSLPQSCIPSLEHSNVSFVLIGCVDFYKPMTIGFTNFFTSITWLHVIRHIHGEQILRKNSRERYLLLIPFCEQFFDLDNGKYTTDLYPILWLNGRHSRHSFQW